MKKRMGFSNIMPVITAGVLIVSGVIALMTVRDVSQKFIQKSTSGNTVVIDAGHGGLDPGKVGINGAYEKDINLSIAKELEKILKDKKCDVIMTRTSDEGLYNAADANKKMSDMKERIRRMNDSSPDIIISIHQNSFTSQNSKGAQVFYQTESEEGKKCAEFVQRKMAEKLDKNNRRQAKANSDYYILKKSEKPAIIVECGFLSNSDEAALLIDSEYQKKVAGAIAEGVLEYLELQ